MLPLILGSAGLGAALGGVQGYQQSGGDLGRTVQGALSGGLLGGVTGGLGGAAGSLVKGGIAGTNPALFDMLMKKQRMGLGLSPNETKLLGITNAAGNVANIGTQLVGGALLAPAAGALTNLAGQVFGGPAKAAAKAAELAAGIQQTQGPGPVKYDQNGVPIGTDRYGGYGGYSPADVLLGQGLTQRLEYAKNIEATRDAMRVLNPEIFAAGEAAKKTEFQRQMAAAGIRQNIATAANMLERSQQAAQQMGATAASQAGAALTSQYQYQ